MKPSLRASVFSRIAAISLFSITGIFMLIIHLENSNFSEDALRARNEYVTAQKRLLRSEVDRAVAYIGYMKSRTETLLRSSIEARVHEAHAMATHIFDRYRDRMPKTEIAALVKEILRPIRFNQGRGYFFIADLRGTMVLLPIQPDAEGKDYDGWQDVDGRYVLRTAANVVRTKKQGFFEYRWPKPGVPDQEFRKVSFVKVFEPFDWFIGTGEYIDDVKADIQAEVVARMEKIRFGEDGYIFAGQWDGLTVFGPGKGRNMWDVTDVNGVKIVQEMIAAARKGGGFVSYVLPPFTGTRHTEKISFAAPVPGWQWYVGAGVYVDTIEEQIERLRGELKQRLSGRLLLYGLFFLGLSLAAFLAANRLAGHVDTVVNSFLGFFNAARAGGARIDPVRQPYAEFAQLAEAANEMAARRENAEAALRRSEERYREIVEGTDNLVTEVDVEGRITFVNEASRRVFGLEPKACIGRQAFDFIHPEDRQRTLDQFARWIDAKTRSTAFENRQVDISGRVRDMLWTTNFHFAADGQVKSIKSIARDITERKQTEKLLIESERRLSEAQKLVKLGHWFWNVETGEVEWSEEVYKLFGLEPEKFTPQIDSILQLSPWPEDRRRDQELIQRAMKSREPGEYEQRFLRSDGGIGYYFSTFQGIYDKDGRLIAMRGTAQDITERKRAEEELSRYRDHLEDLVAERALELRCANDDLQREINERKRVEGALRDSERRLAEIFDFLPDATMVVDRQGRVQLWNHAMEDMTGIAAADILGKGDYAYALPFYGQRRPILADLAMMRNAHVEEQYLSIKTVGERLVAEAYTPRLGSGGVYTWGSARPLYDARGEVVGAIESVRDITDQKRSEKALRQYADTQTVLVREVNHRVKNNLSAIIGMLHMEQDRAEAEGLDSYIPVLRDLVGRIEGLSTVHSLLSASGWRPLEVGELCRQVAGAALQGIPLGKRIDVAVSPSRVHISSGQAHHLTLVINELTTNAVKYALGDRDQARIAIRVLPDGHDLEILFQDDGPGYPKPIIEDGLAPASIGFELIRGITRHSLGGEVVFSNDGGASARIRFRNKLENGEGES